MDDLRKTILLDLLDQAFSKKAWHGTNLRGSIRGLTVGQAIWRPQPDRHNIAEQVLHAAYWKYTVRRLLRDDKKGSFPIKGSNWFSVGEGTEEAGWRSHVRLLEAEHESLREAVRQVPTDLWLQKPSGSKHARLFLVQGISAHDLYHAGQIQLLKRLMG